MKIESGSNDISEDRIEPLSSRLEKPIEKNSELYKVIPMNYCMDMLKKKYLLF